ncbi:MAG: protein translocase subunit SecD [Ignavibacteria bacterium CG_4_8_14_3_um_filter_37_9]|nr:protein translocase subunit SecD [Ignavibacteria bacterium]OIO23246.1 MAG: protein-export membrane protein SecD [Ignavibacteria bacterium CG1_02_37_35]PIP77582.1 MAG: protein translocase subunit SecD [Ignavibacteria bacterium CG22_combo_CG10-13_8_21_14_all_37_15]PIS45364.1 MAG: protein translocase subunit SecD [Ignavibacteria bacterium CG08_land_8_20_14_0_20_37_9]PIX00356.1 MAG: protein translocase subunit SecD [Ignavibacteria bacterium CG_4_8_14_3_um_filter_37_9]PIX94449.1 MAG: protein tra
MKALRFRFIIILAAIAISIYLLYPTIKDYQNTKHISEAVKTKRELVKKVNPAIAVDQLDKILQNTSDSIKAGDPSIRETRAKRIKLGLDLQGGMRVVLEVNTVKLLEKLANNPDDVFRGILAASGKEAALSDESVVDIVGANFQRKGIRLSRYFGTIRQDDAEILKDLKKQSEEAVTRAKEIIRNRVDQYGVAEPSIQLQGERRIIVELPGVAKEEEARQLLQGTALLEFKLLKEPEFTINIMEQVDKVLTGKSLVDTSSADTTKNVKKESKDSTLAKSDTSKNQKLSPEQFAKEHPFFSVALINPQSQSADAYVKSDQKEKLLRMLAKPEVQNLLNLNNAEFVLSAKPVTYQEGQGVFVLYLVNKTAELTGSVVTNASSNIDPSTSTPVVNMEMNSEGATEWARITGANINKRCAIVLDNVVYSAPVIRGKIPGGRSQIEGSTDLAEAKLLEIVLKAGALPAPVDIIEERTVGPSLGQDSISQGFNSALYGYILVGIFMIFYYRKAGTIAAIVLSLVILFILSVLAYFKATLTLPGIAGIVLTIGMAVDANVLIFERIREELATGKTMKASIDGGFSKALSAIVDSNITTFFTGVILYQFGTGPIQGFALTLMIGIGTSLFGALVVTRVLLDFLLNKGYKITLG